MNMSSMIGFDPSIVNQSIASVKNAYESLIDAICTRMQNDFVGGMQDKWCCKQAQDFFNNIFKPAVDQLINSSNQTFESVVSSMNSAAQAWAENTDSSYTSQSFEARTTMIDTGGILENISGIRGIDKDNAATVASKLVSIASDAKAALTNAQSAVQNCGFIGGNQASNLINSVGIIKTNIDNATTQITTDTENAINETISNYSDTEGRISQAFQIQG